MSVAAGAAAGGAEMPAAELTAELQAAGVPVDVSARRRAEYSSDASNYRVVPQAVAFPRHAADVLAALAVCRALDVPLTARGGGTSIAGNSIGPGLVLDFSRGLNRVLSVDPEARTAVVQPGAVLDDISTAAAPYGLRFGPNPATHARATVGGAIGNNACGSRTLAYGRTAENVVDLDVVTAAGGRFTATRLAGPADPKRTHLATSGEGAGPGVARPKRVGSEAAGSERAGPEVVALEAAVRGSLGVIRTEFGRFPRQISGYSLEHLLPERGADLARFLVGTEGTLAIVVGATVSLVPAPAATALVVLGYPDLADAADAVPALLPLGPAALEGMDARLVDGVRRRRGPGAVPDLPPGAGWLLAETAGDTDAAARASAERVRRAAGTADATILTGAAARAFWAIREDGAGLGGRTPANRPAWAGWEDSAVPPHVLGAYLRELGALLAAHRLDGLLYGHFGDGCVHGRLDFPLRADPSSLRSFVTEAADLAASYGGSFSGEHGDGRARGELLPRMYSPAAIRLFAAVKHAFDPDNLLNPGVVVDPAPLDADLRVPRARGFSRGLGFAYPDDDGDFTTAVHRCIGVGRCRADNTAAHDVMCPSFLATRDEKDSTRGRARVLQEMANGSLVTRGWRSPELAESLDLCLACKGCASDCPTGVDMATYKAEVLYHRYRRRPRPRSHYALGWLPRWARLAERAPRAANALLAGPLAAVARSAAGVDRRRPLPRVAAQTFRQWFGAEPHPADRQPVLLWADTFTNHFSPEVGRAAVRVLAAAGYSVRVTDHPVCCGLTWLTTGQLDAARRELRRSLDALGPALAAGLAVVGLEPSCTAVLRREVTRLLPDDPRSGQLAAATRTLAETLRATAGWQPPDLRGVHGVAQPHCHQHAVLGWDEDAALLRSAAADVTAVGGCCGLAGDFGFERGHYGVSVAVAETALLPAVRAAGPGAVVLADGFSCRTQLDHLAGKHALHLAELLAAHLPPA
ncbi:MAG TPA: FAD-linked oxidase C-terminal domain-containing protein [Nocardioidaceae bacterium]|nr:FAD-linked oxidase C-terminal domain-containing protein [Nocardioidaceae bacterium]